MTTNVLTRLQKNVRIIIEKLGLGGTLITTAVSGGPDSLCMLHILDSISKDTGIGLWGAHLDHGIRPVESEKDAEFVKSIFEEMSIPYSTRRLDIPSLSKKEGTSMELTARIHRHLFLANVSQSNNSSITALGHNAGDQAETILMHLIRGTGLKGLTGMQQFSDRTIAGVGMKLLRPLLFISRETINSYCNEANLDPRIDKTNLSLEHTRNVVRRNLIPVLKTHNPKIEEALLRLSKSTIRDMESLDQATDTAYSQATKETNGIVSISKSVLGNLPEAIIYRVLRRAASILVKDHLQLTMTHIDSIADLLDGQSGKSINLPGGVTVTNSYADLIFRKSEQDIASFPKLPDITKVRIPGNTSIPGWKIETFIQSNPESINALSDRNNTAWVPHDPAVETISVRARLPGDRFQPKGMTKEKKLQDFMVDAKIPRDWRDRIPIVVIRHRGVAKIAWVVGWRVAEWATISPGDKKVFIRFSRTQTPQ